MSSSISSQPARWPSPSSWGACWDLLDLDAEELLLVIPLVEGLCLVEALVALKPDEPGSRQAGDAFRELGLSGTGRPLDEDRLQQPVGEVDDSRQPVVSEVSDRGETVANLVDGDEAGL